MSPSRGQRERKFATALFVDVVGYTALVEQHDPEIVDALIRRAFGPLMDEIIRHGGLVERTIGDAILALFGVPATHEDDPERAVRAGLQLHAIVSELNRELEAEGRPRLDLRVGIEAGEVLVDLGQVEGSHDRMLTGDAVNVAARLQAIATPGTVLVGPRVHAATREIVEYEESDPLELKGKSEPVVAWTARRVKARLRGQRASTMREAALVGRDEELAILKRSLERAEAERRPLLATIFGPPGVGKSRLVRELGSHVEDLPGSYYWRVGRSHAYGDVAYSGLVEVVKAQCEISEDDPSAVAEEKIERAVNELCGDDSLVHEVRVLIGVSGDHSFSREQLFDAWQHFLERMAARYPLVLVFEDIHWADDGLLDFIDYVADWARGPIVIAAAARPDLLERRNAWGGGKRNYAAIYLGPLSTTESELMLDELTSDSLPAHVKRAVLDRSEGNPLFTEEIVRMFVDRGTLRATTEGEWEFVGDEQHIEVPGSIQTLIAARLDGLSTDERTILQDAAVVGRIFWSGAVADLTGRAIGEAKSALRSLQSKEIVVPRDVPAFSDQSEFSFHHVLIRDVAYESLPKAERVEKHVHAARWLEGQAGDRREELAATIASHFVASLRYRRELGEPLPASGELVRDAYAWTRAAGDHAVRVWDSAEATRWYREAIDLAAASQVPGAELAELWESYAGASSRRMTPDETAAAYGEAMKLYETLGRAVDTARVETTLANYFIEVGRDGEVPFWADRALARLVSREDSEDLARALFVKGRYLWITGAFAEAEPLLRRSLELAQKFDSVLIEAHVKTTLGSLLHMSKRRDEGHAMLEEALVLARGSGDLAVYFRCLNNLASGMWDIEDFARGEALYREAIDVARRAGDLAGEAWLTGALGNLLGEKGQIAEAEVSCRRSLECARLLQSPLYFAQGYMGLAWLMVVKGDLDEAQRLCSESVIAKEEAEYEPWLRSNEGLIAIARDDVDLGVSKLLESFHLQAEQTHGEGREWQLIEMIRALARLDRATEAEPHQERLRELAEGRGQVRKLALWGEGLVAKDPRRQIDLLRQAAEGFASIDWVLRRGMALIDLGRAYRRAEQDPRASLLEAREILERAGAGLYVREVDDELARLESEGVR